MQHYHHINARCGPFFLLSASFDARVSFFACVFTHVCMRANTRVYTYKYIYTSTKHSQTLHDVCVCARTCSCVCVAPLRPPCQDTNSVYCSKSCMLWDTSDAQPHDTQGSQLDTLATQDVEMSAASAHQETPRTKPHPLFSPGFRDTTPNPARPDLESLSVWGRSAQAAPTPLVTAPTAGASPGQLSEPAAGTQAASVTRNQPPTPAQVTRAPADEPGPDQPLAPATDAQAKSPNRPSAPSTCGQAATATQDLQSPPAPTLGQAQTATRAAGGQGVNEPPAATATLPAPASCDSTLPAPSAQASGPPAPSASVHCQAPTATPPIGSPQLSANSPSQASNSQPAPASAQASQPTALPD